MARQSSVGESYIQPSTEEKGEMDPVASICREPAERGSITLIRLLDKGFQKPSLII